MLLYSIIVLVSIAITVGLNMLFNPTYHDQLWMYAVLTVGAAVIVFILDALVAIIIRKMPEKWFQEDKGLFKTGPKEFRFYKFLRVNKWKNYVPELGSFTGFHKNQFANPFDNEYVARFILEARYGVAIHVYSVPVSFLVILCDWNMYIGNSNIWLTIGLPVAIINAILIVLPAFILKYNLPTLVRIYNNNLEKQKKKAQVEEE